MNIIYIQDGQLQIKYLKSQIVFTVPLTEINNKNIVSCVFGHLQY